MLVVSGPSGAGKTSVVRGLVLRCPAVLLAVSATTRPARAGERDGVDYYFLTEEEFARRERAGAFLETAIVHGNRYGTLRAPVEEALGTGRPVVLEIDVQGARSIREVVPGAVLVFVEPPSAEVLRARLEARNTESARALEVRLANAAQEMAAATAFDHRVVNDDLERAISEVVRILEGAGEASPPTPAEERNG